MKTSDLITEKILELINTSDDNIAQIQRNELASSVGCAPSQINYVLSSRFTPEHGYIIESRRGGGGFIKITRVKLKRSSALMHLINSIGTEIDSLSARIVIENSIQSGIISEEIGKLMQSVTSITVMREVPVEYRDKLRATILKQTLLAQI